MSTRLVFFPFAQSLIDYVKLFLHHKKCLKFGNIKIIIFFWLDEPRSAWNYPEIFMWRNSQNCKSWEFWKNLFFVNFCKYKKTSTSLTMGTFCAVFPKTFYFEKKIGSLVVDSKIQSDSTFSNFSDLFILNSYIRPVYIYLGALEFFGSFNFWNRNGNFSEFLNFRVGPNPLAWPWIGDGQRSPLHASSG